MAELLRLGRYHLRRVLGKGAMGVVYEGFDPTLNRRVAVKTILKSVALDEATQRDYSARFVREAQAVGRLNHPHIVQVHDFGEQDEVAYLVMEFIEGRELRAYFEEGVRFETAEAVRIMRELLDALEFAHDKNVIHRDVKPANVMLDPQRQVKLADFGVARVQDSERSAAGTMVGTPAFMSPEQISGGKIDRRTDVFSAGVILYQLLTGAQPFKGEGAWTVARMIMQDDPPPPSRLAGSASPVFDGIVSRALAKKPADRFASAKEFRAALRAAQRGVAASGALPVIAAGAAPAKQAPPAKEAPKASETELEFWRALQNSNDAAEFEFYLEQFPDGTYAQLARHKIAKLRESQETVRWNAEEKAASEAKARAKREAEDDAIREALEKTRRDAAEKAQREAEKKSPQTRVRALPAVDADATVAIGGPAKAPAPPTEAKRSLVIPVAIAAVVVAAGVVAYQMATRSPAPSAPAAQAPAPAAQAPAAVAPAIDVEKVRRETEERIRREYADKAAAEKAALEKAAAAGKIAAEKAAAEKASAEKAAEAARKAAEKVASAKSAQEKAALEKAAAIEKAAAERAAAAERTAVAAERAAAERVAAAEKAARLTAEKAAAEKAARLTAEKAAEEKAARVSAEKVAEEKAAAARAAEKAAAPAKAPPASIAAAAPAATPPAAPAPREGMVPGRYAFRIMEGRGGSMICSEINVQEDIEIRAGSTEGISGRLFSGLKLRFAKDGSVTATLWEGSTKWQAGDMKLAGRATSTGYAGTYESRAGPTTCEGQWTLVRKGG